MKQSSNMYEAYHDLSASVYSICYVTNMQHPFPEHLRNMYETVGMCIHVLEEGKG